MNPFDEGPKRHVEKILGADENSISSFYKGPDAEILRTP